MTDSKKPTELSDSDLGDVTGGLIDTFPLHATGESTDGKDGVVTEEITFAKGESAPRDGTADGSKIVAGGGGSTI